MQIWSKCMSAWCLVTADQNYFLMDQTRIIKREYFIESISEKKILEERKTVQREKFYESKSIEKRSGERKSDLLERESRDST